MKVREPTSIPPVKKTMSILYLVLIGRGKKPEEALKSVLGMKPEERKDALKTYEDKFKNPSQGIIPSREAPFGYKR